MATKYVTPSYNHSVLQLFQAIMYRTDVMRGRWQSWLSTVTKLWAGWPRDCDFVHSKAFRLALGLMQPLIQWVLKSQSLNINQPSC